MTYFVLVGLTTIYEFGRMIIIYVKPKEGIQIDIYTKTIVGFTVCVSIIALVYYFLYKVHEHLFWTEMLQI